MTLLSHSPEETLALGQAWGRALAPAAILGLSGELGAGKTELVRGLAKGLGYPGQVHSPTFNLINEYWGGRLPLFHLDLYRLDGRRDWLGTGLDEYLQRTDGITVIEWIDRLEESRPFFRGGRLYRHVELLQTAELTRQITYEDFGV